MLVAEMCAGSNLRTSRLSFTKNRVYCQFYKQLFFQNSSIFMFRTLFYTVSDII